MHLCLRTAATPRFYAVGALLGAALSSLCSVASALEPTESVLGEPTVQVDRITTGSIAESFQQPEGSFKERVRLAARAPRVFTTPQATTPDKAESDAPARSIATGPLLSGTNPELKGEKKEAKKRDSEESTDATSDEDAAVEASKQAAAKQKEPPAPLSRSLRYLRSRMRTVLSYYYRKPMNSAQNTPWEIMHGMLAYELHSRVRYGSPQGDPMTAVGHLCYNRPSKHQRMMRVNAEGGIDVEIGVGLQGHGGQLMAMLAQCNVSPEYPVRVDGRMLKISDLVASEQQTCYPNTELTFKLIGLGHYLASDAEWKNDRGEAWDIPRLIREERTQPIRGAACGGTHRLAGLSLAYRRREARGEPIDGEYLEAARFVSQYQTMAFRLQNSDGSLSTEWFRGRGAEPDIERRIRTTGHLLEWLVYSLPDQQLRSPRTVRAVSYLTNLLANNANFDWHPGSLGHALHALVVYDKRVFQPLDDVSGIAVSDTIDPKSGRYRGYAINRGVMRNSSQLQNRPSGFHGLFGSRSTGRKTR